MTSLNLRRIQSGRKNKLLVFSTFGHYVHNHRLYARFLVPAPSLAIISTAFLPCGTGRQTALREEGDLSLWIDHYDEERYNVVRTDKDSQPRKYHYSGIIILHFEIKC